MSEDLGREPTTTSGGNEIGLYRGKVYQLKTARSGPRVETESSVTTRLNVG